MSRRIEGLLPDVEKASRSWIFPDLGIGAKIGAIVPVNQHFKVKNIGLVTSWVTDPDDETKPLTCRGPQAHVTLAQVNDLAFTAPVAKCKGCDMLWPSNQYLEFLKRRGQPRKHKIKNSISFDN